MIDFLQGFSALLICGLEYLGAEQVTVQTAWCRSFERAMVAGLLLLGLSWLLWRSHGKRACANVGRRPRRPRGEDIS